MFLKDCMFAHQVRERRWFVLKKSDDDDDVCYYIGERPKLEGETESMGFPRDVPSPKNHFIGGITGFGDIRSLGDFELIIIALSIPVATNCNQAKPGDEIIKPVSDWPDSAFGL